MTDRSDKIIEVNDAFCKISGYSADELLSPDHRILSSGADSKAFWTKMWRHMFLGDTWREEVCNRTKDGQLFWVDTASIPFEALLEWAY